MACGQHYRRDSEPGGLTVLRKRSRKATPSQSSLRHAGGANQVWCTDFKAIRERLKYGLTARAVPLY